MKLRIFNNSIRLRLRQGEVAQFASDGLVEARVEFGGGTALAYRLVADEQAATASVSFRNCELEVRVPREEVTRWADSSEVAISAEQDNGSGELLAVLIEKDFQCMHHGASDADAYPNPMLQGVD